MPHIYLEMTLQQNQRLSAFLIMYAIHMDIISSLPIIHNDS